MSYNGLRNHILRKSIRNKDIEFKIIAYTHSVTVSSFGYFGGVYSPTQNRIYLVPMAQSVQPTWHYIAP